MSAREEVPVLVVPSTLHFTAPLSSHAAQLLTLYNPYSVNFNYKISCTAPALYTVQPNSGSIPRNSQLQVMVRLRPAATMAESSAAAGSGSGSGSSAALQRVSNRDRFMVELYEEGTRVLRGKQVIAVEYNGGGSSGTQGASAAWTPAAPASSSHHALSAASSSRSSSKHAPSSAAHASSHYIAASSSSAASAAAAHNLSKWSSLALPLRLLPLLVGTVLVGLIASGELVVSRHGFERGGAVAAGGGKVLSAATAAATVPCVDDPIKLWLCFCIGLITCATQMKFFEL